MSEGRSKDDPLQREPTTAVSVSAVAKAETQAGGNLRVMARPMGCNLSLTRTVWSLAPQGIQAIGGGGTKRRTWTSEDQKFKIPDRYRLVIYNIYDK